MRAPPDIVAIKSFGDLVIALNALSHLPAGTPCPRLLVGAHLRPLLAALGDEVEHVLLDHGESGVPSAYDVRKNGIVRACRSMISLRRAIAAAHPAGLLFPSFGARERFLASGISSAALPAAANIYLAYASAMGLARAEPQARHRENHHPVGLFPGSRLAAKNLPLSLIEAILAAIAASGSEARLFTLAGERPDIESSDLPATVVETRFEAMIAAIESCKAIVSADSMPAHIAEKLAIPVFVATPVENSYWLPLTSFLTGRWSLFAQGAGGPLPDFLERMNGQE